MVAALLAWSLFSGPVAADGLAAFVDRDLTTLSRAEATAFSNALASLIGPPPKKTEWWTPTPRWVRAYHAGTGRWLLYSVFECLDVPGASRVSADLFDDHWKRLSHTGFCTGYRLFYGKETMRSDSWIPQPTVTVAVRSQGPFLEMNGKRAPAFHPETGFLETYAFDERGAHLIRLADGTGKLLSNSYEWEVPSIGPDPTKRSFSKWSADLYSVDPVRQLTCLVWLGGNHLNSKDWRRKGVSRELVQDSKTYERLRADAAIRQRIKALSASKNPWLRAQATKTQEALAQPLRPVEERPD